MKLKMFSGSYRPAEMAAVRNQLLRTLQDLTDDDFENFKWHLRTNRLIPVADLQNANRCRTVDLLVQYFPRDAVDRTIGALRSINRNDLAEDLSLNNAGGKTWFRADPLYVSV